MLRKDGIGTIFFGEEQLAKDMTGHVLKRFDPQTKGQATASAQV
jgi:CPA2 family monovalent cation:H+ antiporter-2